MIAQPCQHEAVEQCCPPDPQLACVECGIFIVLVYDPDGEVRYLARDAIPVSATYCAPDESGGTEHWHLDRPHIPGTDYYDGRDGSIEAEDDDEDRIAAEDESWRDYLDWQRSLGARN